MFNRRMVIWAVPFVMVACAPNPVPVLGTRTDIAALTGEWVGTYTSGESGREGSIVFQLEAGADTAQGDVMMRAV